MIRDWLFHHPLTGFFALVVCISWGAIAVITLARGVDLSPLHPVEGGLLFLMMLLGPSLGGIACIALLDGRAGLLATWQSARHRRVTLGWWAVALLPSR